MLVGDIYGDRDYSNIGLSATTIASSFGKVVTEGKDLEDVDPADIALAHCREGAITELVLLLLLPLPLHLPCSGPCPYI